MLDRYALPLLKTPLTRLALGFDRRGIKADQVSLIGFGFALIAMGLISQHAYLLGAVFLVLNRLCDGIDGELARRQGSSDAGAFLDIALDFVSYSGIVFAFALAAPEHNALAACALIFSFIGTGTSFLAFSILAERRKAQSVVYPNKGIYYLTGIMEGTETIVLLLLFCLLPEHFAILAWSAAGLCYLSAALRIWGGYWLLRD